MKITQIPVHIFLLVIFLVRLSFSININKNNKIDLLDLDQELNKKLDDLFSYYKHIIKNTDANQSNKDKLMNSLNKRADSLVKNTNLIEKTKITNSEDKTQQISFIQSGMEEKNELFSYQPFVWTEFTINNKGPSPRRGHSTILADTYLIIFGGCYMDSKCYNDLYFLDLRSQSWIQIATTGMTPSPRQGHTAVLYGSTMWVYGGSSSEGFMNDLYSLNLETREWKKNYFSGALTIGRAGHGSEIDSESRIIVFGGYSDRGYLNDLFFINILEERFETPSVTGKIPTPRENFAFVLVNNRIYLFGGFQEGGVLNDSFSIDILSWEWIQLTLQGPTPPPQQGMAFTRVGKKIYLTGGCDFRLQKCFTETFILDTDSLWWRKVENNKSDLTGRGDFTLSFFRGNLYTFGGCEMYKKCFDNVFIMNVNDVCPNKCSRNGECKEIIGCVCTSPWITHDCSQKIKCKDNCSNNGICHNNGKCGCHPGWRGIICNTLIPCPLNCTDFQNGICENDSTCKCKPGFTGNDCSQYTIIGNETISNGDPFKVLLSIESKRVNEETDELLKESPDLYKFLNNTNELNKTCPKNCSDHGKCNYKNGKCHCDLDYIGEDCSVDFAFNFISITHDPTEMKLGTLNKTHIQQRNNKTNAKRTNETDDPNEKADQNEKTDPSEKTDSNEKEDPNEKADQKEKSDPNEKADKGDEEEEEKDDDDDKSKNKKHEAENITDIFYKINGEFYYHTNDCKSNCTNKGICLNSTCFCRQGYTSEDCSMLYKQYLDVGYKFSDMSKFIFITFAISAIITLIVLIYKRSQKITGDHLVLDDIE